MLCYLFFKLRITHICDKSYWMFLFMESFLNLKDIKHYYSLPSDFFLKALFILSNEKRKVK